MKSMLRKGAAGLVIVAAALLANPWNVATAVPEETMANPDRAALRQCVRANRQARDAATSEFRRALRGAQDLAADERRPAVEAAQAKFRQAAEQARAAFSACIEAARGTN